MFCCCTKRNNQVVLRAVIFSQVSDCIVLVGLLVVADCVFNLVHFDTMYNFYYHWICYSKGNKVSFVSNMLFNILIDLN